MDKQIILNGEFHSASSNYLNTNRAFRYGDGLFESIKIINGNPISLEYHFQRITAGLEALMIKQDQTFNLKKINALINALITHNKIENGGKIRLSVFRNGQGTYQPENNDLSYLIEAVASKNNYYELNESGISVDVFKDIYKPINYISKFKTLNALIYVLAAEFANKNMLDDSLIINATGKIIEATASNIFIVSNGVLYTPPLEDGCIGGIMRMTVINTALSNNITVYENSLMPQNLLNADEVFLTNTISGITWVRGFQQKRYYNDTAKKIIGLINEQVVNYERDLKGN